MTMRAAAIPALAFACALLLLAFVAGVEAQKAGLWPARAWSKARSQLHEALPPANRDRQAVACPTNGMVVLVIGQSHGANYVAERFSGRPGVINAFRGNCYPARDPLLGPEGDKGNLWTQVGNQAVGSGLAPAVTILNTAIGSSKLAQFAPGGSLHRYLRDSIAGLPKGQTITHVAIQIGEGDYQEGTSEFDFTRSLTALIASLRAQGIAAPVYLARESLYCSPARVTNPIAKVQRTFRGQGVFAGPNMDALPFDRYDGCHLSKRGAREYAAQWVEIFATANLPESHSSPPAAAVRP